MFLKAWGGHNTVARALRAIQDEFGQAADWPQMRDRISAKAVVTSFGHQDSTFADCIRTGLRWRAGRSRRGCGGLLARTVVADADRHLLSAEWMRRNVSAVGPLGAQYRVWGDGRQMAAGFDAEDYFGLSGLTVDELAARGYEVWMPPQERGAFISEGDSSNFALLVDNGLRSWVALGLDRAGVAVSFVVPPAAAPGETFHVICTARDSGTPSLTRHQRVVVTVTG